MQKQLKSSNVLSDKLIFFLLLGIGAAWRLTMLSSHTFFWGDEQASIATASLPWNSIFSKIYSDVHPPFYFLILKCFIAVFGKNSWSYRLPSFVAGMGTLVMIYACGKEMVGRKSALLALLFASFSPYLIHASHEARNHGMAAFFCAAGTYYFFKSAKEEKKIHAIYFTFFAACAVYTSHFAWFWLAGIAIYWRKAPVGLISAGLVSLPAFLLLLRDAYVFEKIYIPSFGSTLTPWKYALHYCLNSLYAASTVPWHQITGFTYFYLKPTDLLGLIEKEPFSIFSVLLCLGFMALWVRGMASTTLEAEFISFSIFNAVILFLPVLLLSMVHIERVRPQYFCYAAPFLFLWLAQITIKQKKNVPLALTVLFLLVSTAADFYLIRLAEDPVARFDGIGSSLLENT